MVVFAAGAAAEHYLNVILDGTASEHQGLAARLAELEKSMGAFSPRSRRAPQQGQARVVRSLEQRGAHIHLNTQILPNRHLPYRLRLVGFLCQLALQSIQLRIELLSECFQSLPINASTTPVGLYSLPGHLQVLPRIYPVN